MPMTDAPNFGTKFGRRKPCLRYIGPLLHTTSVAPVGRGDLTPPSVHSRSHCRGRAPSRPVGERLRFTLISVGSQTPPPRRGGPTCPPGHTSAQNPRTDRHTGRPLQILSETSITPPGSGRGQSPAPTEAKSNEHPTPVRDLPGHPKPRLPQTQNTRNDRRHLAPIPRPNVKKHPRPSPNRGFQRGPQPPLVVGGVWGRNRNAPRIFLGKREGIFF